MPPTISTTQISFFKKIKDILPPQFSVVDEVADILGLSNDSAYRRLRGETALSIDELKLLCKRFNVTLNDVDDENSDAVVFSYKAINNTEITLETYLQSIDDDISKITRFADKEITYAAKDIPLFHHFHFPELAAFKIFFWMKSILDCPSHEGKVFDAGTITQVDVDLGQKILKTYTSIPSVEIWTEETLNSTVKQLEYYWESGFIIDKATALLICDQMGAMIAHVQQQAAKGVKYRLNGEASEGENNFKLYYSEVMIGNNNILVRTGNSLTSYVTHNTLNYLITSNQGFCNETEGWLKGLVKRSVPLSGSSEKQRNQFFRKAFESINSLKQKITQS